MISFFEYHGNEGTQFGRYDRNDNVSLTVNYSFYASIRFLERMDNLLNYNLYFVWFYIYLFSIIYIITINID